MSHSTTDAALLESCLKGQKESFEVLVGRYQSLVCAITYGATGSLDKSEELAQETFLLAWKNLRQLKDLAKFKAWLCQIARSVIQNWFRARKRDVENKVALMEKAASDPTALSPTDAAIQQEQQAVVNQAIEVIPEQYRVPLILFYRENKSTREVATIIGLNENATRQRISRARGLLKDHVAAVVETTLVQTKPGKAFTAGVLASVAGLSIKGAATATAAGVVHAGASTLVVKVTVIAAGLLLVAGVTFMAVKPKATDTQPAQTQTQGLVAAPNEPESSVLTPVEASASPDQGLDAATQVTLLPTDQELPPDPETTTRPYEFTPTGVLSGLITDAETGEPVRDASIRVNGHSVRADNHGFYHVDKIFRPGNCTVFVDSNDYVGFGLNANAPILNLTQDQQVVKHFQLPRACKIEVWVVDVNGVGLEGAEVIPTSLAGRPTKINDHGRSRHTDANGHLLLGGFAPLSTDYMITALAKETVRTTSEGNGLFLIETQFTHCPASALVRLTNPNVTTQVKIVLERGETVHGYAEYNDQVPAEGVKIGVQPSWWHCYSSQDFYPVNPDGTFAIRHVVPDTYNIILATTNDAGLPISSKTIMQKELPQAEAGLLRLLLPIASPQASVSISGHFVFQGNTQPDHVMVTATSQKNQRKSMDFPMMPGDPARQSFRLDSLEPGPYRLRFSGQNIETKTLRDIVAPCLDLAVELNIMSLPRIQGFVIDEATEKPVPHFQIRLRKTETLRGANTMPSENWITFNQTEGDFSIDTVGPGIYQVQALADGYAPSWSAPINTDEKDQAIVMPLSQGGTLTGRILNQAGDFVDDARVIPLSWASGIHSRTQTLFANENGAALTTDGFFTLSHLPEGSESLKIVHSDYAFETVRDIEVKAGQVAQVSDIVLSSGGSVEGFILDEQDNPLANQTLCFCDAMTGTTEDPSQRWTTVITDANGFYAAHHLPAQPCNVYQGKLYRMRGVIRRTVTPLEGETIRLDFGGNFKVRGIIEVEDKVLPLRRIKLSAPIPAHFECFTMTDDSGFFTLSGVVPGPYQLTYELPDNLGLWQEVASVTVVNEDLDLGVLNGTKRASQVPGILPLAPVSTEPTPRHLSLKLPLLQPQFHWTFMSQAETLAGKLILRITRGREVTEIIIFAGGQISEGWRAITLPENPKAGEIYFGFESTQPYLTAPDDLLELELQAATDLDGIGTLLTGILRAGIYRAQGTYTRLMDEYVVPAVFKDMPQETIDKLRKMVEFRAVLETWDPQWSLDITGEQGWLDGEQRLQMERLLEQVGNVK